MHTQVHAPAGTTATVARDPSTPPSEEVAALVARWESLDESRRSAGVAHGQARALLDRLRGMDGIPWTVASNSTESLLWHVGTIKDAADARFAAADHATALALHAAGPAEVGAWTYRGACVGGLWVVVKQPLEFAVEDEAPPAAHACTAIESDSETA